MERLQVILDKDREYMPDFIFNLGNAIINFSYKPVYAKWGMIIYLLLLQNPAS
ncbi:hypothetical protein M3O96_20820 [Aquiflexum sp. TKW24L]|uniref:hypothetical protein n=1 Tax=Aquiflexum sp. TKW24L TaxID=2942212 RepID=UPI0020BF65A5|nr:hypothetical protein [Aquiflexum sp. TKW24L]MCL6261556.1 hypothetical protein [Aquiflexum sp. TKW24L]